MLDDARHVAGAVADDAAVSRGVGQHHREQAHAVRARGGHEARERVELHQRHVAVQHQHEVVVGNLRHRLHHRVARAVLLGLQDPADVGALEGLEHLLAAVAVHHAGGRGLEAAGGVEHVPEQRPARERLQHLGQVRFHALALAGGQDHDGEWHRGIHNRWVGHSTQAPALHPVTGASFVHAPGLRYRIAA